MSPMLEPPVVMAEAPRPIIGQATMESDGTIVMLILVDRGGILGNARLRYPPGTPENDEARARMPDLTPGKTVPVYKSED